MKKLKIMVIFGTRPEAIKMAPVVKELQKHSKLIKTIVCVTGQHRQMLDQVLDLFEIKPDIDLNLMQENQSLASLTSQAMPVLTKAIIRVKPDIVLVQGDTTTAMIAALAAFYQRIPVGHIEAGLRTEDKYNPFPEEINRRVISAIATYNFAPTKSSADALLKENIPSNSIYLTGNTVIDALHAIVKAKLNSIPQSRPGNRKKIILVTAHRRENFGQPLRNICNALKILASKHKEIEVIYPVHMNPNVKNTVYAMLSGIENIKLISPLKYSELVYLLKNAYLVLTDSGGIQEEAPAFGKPVLVMRIETERPEGIKAGTAKLVGTDTEKIVKQVEILLRNTKEYNKMSRAISPYGDGRAAKRIVNTLLKNRG